ncbi:hypothetical protein F4801DRAFT_559430 [Xylaria longipes]|nr:hypothetical protein F4801DRAFT_559430 [Xylaria longipes]
MGLMSQSENSTETSRRKSWFLRFYRYATRPLAYITSVYRLFGEVCGYLSRAVDKNKNKVRAVPRYDENGKLAAIWGVSDKSNVVFIALDVQASNNGPNRIADIGLSLWCLDDIAVPQSYYWQISDEAYVDSQPNPNNLDPFLHGSTRLICEKNIGHVMDSVFRDAALSYETLCIVGHNISTKLDLLGAYWSTPEGTIVLDIEKMWQAWHRTRNRIDLDELIQTIVRTETHPYMLNNAGNRAREILRLLRLQGPWSVH